MKRKQLRPAKPAKASAAARRPPRRAAAKAKTPARARPAQRKAATKALRRPARAPKPQPVRAPVEALVAPQTLTAGLQELASPPTPLSGLVRQAQAAQPLPALPAPPAPAKAKAKAAAPPAQPRLPIPPILLEGDERARPVPTGPAEKYVLGLAPPTEPPRAEPSELPEAYGTGKLFLTARDPHCLYAHWDFTEAQQRRFSAFAHHLALRVYQDNLSGAPVAETQVHPEARHGFVSVARAGVHYLAQLGSYQPGGEWLVLATSEPAATPPESVAADKTVRWATVTPLVSEPAPRVPAVMAPAPVAPLQATPAPEPVVVAAPVQVAPATQEGRGIYVASSSAELRAVALSKAPEIPAVKRPEGRAPAAQPAPAAPVSVAAPPQWTPAQERVLEELVEIALAQQRTVGSAEIAELVQRRLRREISVPAEQPGASLPPLAPLPLGGPASLPIGVEQQALGISSPPGGVPPGPARQFWFNVNVEVVVYGATEPDASVTLGGRPLRLRPDGTFSCRFSLPDGRYDLAAVATSSYGEARRADLELGRRTDYHSEAGVQPQDPALRPPAPENLQAAQAT